MEPSRPTALLALSLLICAAASAQQAPIPAADELNGRPYSIRQTWVIGGVGAWDYLTIDPVARQLFIAHQNIVQVVDVSTGRVSGQIQGFADAHAIVLDPDGQTGYVSDGRAGLIRIFDRRSLAITASIPVPGSPRALVLDPQSGLLVAFAALPAPPPKPDDWRTRLAAAHSPQKPNSQDEPNPCSLPSRRYPPPPPALQSLITVIDPEKQVQVAQIQVCGTLGAAQADPAGQVYFTIADLAQVGRLDLPALLSLREKSHSAELARLNGSLTGDGFLLLDLRRPTAVPSSGIFRTTVSEQLELYGLGSDCQGAAALALDPEHARLFAGCANQRVQVLNTETGQPVAALTIGPGVDVMSYDAGRGLLFTANGGGYGSVTVIRRHVTDTYAVIQNLPTMQQARTLAVDPSNGSVYLVTTLYGAKLDHPPANGIGTLKMSEVDGSFQVLVVGN